MLERAPEGLLVARASKLLLKEIICSSAEAIGEAS
jgi:hypothetical protein